MNVNELALIVMDAVIKGLCWDCRAEPKVIMEESGQACGCGRGQPASCEDTLNDRRTLRASGSCTTYVEYVAGQDGSGYCWSPPLLGGGVLTSTD